ncbi:MAG TPA: hypothetical protein VH763_11035 [Gemmatimonadales bacterium]|jgi:hypothetical protein
MRRLLALGALLGVLAVAACRDNTDVAPTEPNPQFDKGVPCPTTRLDLTTANTLINQLYANNASLRKTRLASAADIAQKWSQCKVADPQSKVVTFVNALLADFRAGRLAGGTVDPVPARVSALINTMYSGVGLGTPNLPLQPGTGTDFGVGFFTPGKDLLVKTNLSDGAVFLKGNAFNEPTAVTVFLRPNTPNPFEGQTDQTVFPPFFEIIASNLSGNHYLANGTAVVGFCVDEETVLNLLNVPAIAHIAPTQPGHPGGFEILNDASAAQYNGLGLNCTQFVPSEPFGALFDGGLKGFASAAPRLAARYARSLFLPHTLEAAVAKKGLGGLPTSLSPFGVTDRFPSEESENHLVLSNNPDNSHSFEGGLIDVCHDECFPEIQMRDEENNVVGAGTNVTVSLIQLNEGPAGQLTGTKVIPLGGPGVSARFTDLRIDKSGTYQLRFTAPGAEPLTSSTFHVYRLVFSRQPTDPSNTDHTVQEGDFLGETVSGFPHPLVQVKVVDFSGATVTDHTTTVHLEITQGQLNGDVDITNNLGLANFTQNDSSENPQDGLTVFTDGQTLTGLRLEASAFDEPAVLSDPFNVEPGNP